MTVAVVASAFDWDSTDTATISVSSSGSDRCLFIGLKVSGGNTISSATVDGQPLTSVIADPTNDIYTYLYVAPTAGVNNISIVMSGANNWGLIAVALSGVDQSTPTGTAVEANNVEQTSISQAVTGVTDGLVLDFAAMVYDSMTPDASQTRLPGSAPNGDSYFGGFLSIGASSKSGVGSVTMLWNATATFGDNSLIAVPFHPSAGAGGPSISNVDTDDTITSTQTGWLVNGSGLDSSTVDIIQATTTVGQTVNSNSGTEINCDTVFDAGAGPHLKYGAATLEVTNTSGSDTIAITIAAPSGVDYIDIGTPNTTADNRITAVADIASGDQLEISGVVGGTVADVNLYDDGTFDCDEAVTAFDVRCWDAGDSTWGAAATQTVTSGDVTLPVFSGTIPTQNFTQNTDIGSIDLSVYFTDATSYGFNQALPAGLSLNTSSGALTGTPTVAGTFAGFILTGTNVNGSDDSNAFTISVASDQEFTSAGGRQRDGRTRGFMSYIWGRG